MSKRNRFYVGHISYPWGQTQEVFRAIEPPTQETHGNIYIGVTGPFRTLRAAKAMTHYGWNNPHMLSVSDAERISKKYEQELKRLPESSTIRYNL